MKIQAVRSAILEDADGFEVWMKLRGWPGGWESKRTVSYARQGFLRAQQGERPGTVHGNEEADDAYLLGHQLCRDMRSDGPLRAITEKLASDMGAELPEEGAWSMHFTRREAGAICYGWFVAAHAEHFGEEGRWNDDEQEEASEEESGEEASEESEGSQGAQLTAGEEKSEARARPEREQEVGSEGRI